MQGYFQPPADLLYKLFKLKVEFGQPSLALVELVDGDLDDLVSELQQLEAVGHLQLALGPWQDYEQHVPGGAQVVLQVLRPSDLQLRQHHRQALRPAPALTVL